MDRLVTVDMRMIEASGIGTYLRNLVPRLIKRCPEFRFCLIGPEIATRKILPESSNQVEFLDSDVPIYSIREQINIPRLIPANNDILWVPHFNIPLFYRGRMLVTVHDMFHLAMPKYSRLYRRRAARILFKAIAKRADCVLFDSHFTSNEFSRLIPIGPKQSEVVYCGVDMSWFEIRRPDRSQNRPYIIYYGNLKPHKNLHSLLNVMLHYGRLSEYELVLVGKAEGFITGDDEVKRLVAGHQDRVRITGHLSLKELQATVAQAACLVFPSLYEGFGLPPLEAMAAGVPVLVARSSSLPEVCGDAAVYCDPHDENDMAQKLEKLLSDEELSESLTARGKVRAGQFSWETSADKLAGILNGLLSA